MCFALDLMLISLRVSRQQLSLYTEIPGATVAFCLASQGFASVCAEEGPARGYEGLEVSVAQISKHKATQSLGASHHTTSLGSTEA